MRGANEHVNTHTESKSVNWQNPKMDKEEKIQTLLNQP